jgi:hypothetical protein
MRCQQLTAGGIDCLVAGWSIVDATAAQQQYDRDI